MTFYDQTAETTASEEGARIADVLKAQGGQCKVSNGDGFVDVLLKDGRLFRNVGVHGSGGVISPRYGVYRVRKEMGLRGHLLIYLVSGWWGEVRLQIPAEDIVSIDESAPP